MDPKVMADTMWTLVTAMLVFFMNLGFATVEAGFQQSKNCVNILSKNFVVFACSTISFWFIGWGLMFGDGSSFIGLKGLLMLHGADNSPATGDAYHGVYSAIAWTGVPLLAKFFFQLVFAGTAATIVSGSVGGRIKYFSFIIFCASLKRSGVPISMKVSSVSNPNNPLPASFGKRSFSIENLCSSGICWKISLLKQ